MQVSLGSPVPQPACKLQAYAVQVPEGPSAHVTLFRYTPVRRRLLTVCSLGLVALVEGWDPRIKAWLSGTQVNHPDQAQFVLVKNEFGETQLVSLVREEPEFFEPFVVEEHITPAAKDVSVVFFEYQSCRFIFSPSHDEFMNLDDSRLGLDHAFVTNLRHGLDDYSLRHRFKLYGANVVDVQEKSYWQIFVEEVLNPFFLFQLFSVILWMLEQYFLYSITIFVISAFSVATTLIDTKRVRKTKVLLRDDLL
jgi:cation-transporting ATPase 13A3/4/5